MHSSRLPILIFLGCFLMASPLPAQEAKGPHLLSKLLFPTDALEPVMDKKTVQIHHKKHLAGYVRKLNAALKSCQSKELLDLPLEVLIKGLDQVPKSCRAAVRKNAGQVYNHNLFFVNLHKPGKRTEPNKALAAAIVRDFGSFLKLKKEMSTLAQKQFGSGWAWLYLTPKGQLATMSTGNEDSPLMQGLGTPILCIDVWEHAYYLKYNNRRNEYVRQFWALVEWNRVSRKYKSALKRVHGGE